MHLDRAARCHTQNFNARITSTCNDIINFVETPFAALHLHARTGWATPTDTGAHVLVEPVTAILALPCSRIGFDHELGASAGSPPRLSLTPKEVVDFFVVGCWMSDVLKCCDADALRCGAGSS